MPPLKKQKIKQVRSNKKTIATEPHKPLFKNQQVLMTAVLLLTILAYIPFSKAGFIFYSDDLYVLNNELVKDFSLNGIAKIFTSYFYHGYIPLTLLSYAIEFHLWGASGWLYVLTSLCVHLINTILVYKLFKYLTDDNVTPLWAALFFAIHPMHVESVMWIAERKDLLFAFFYLSGAIVYLKYLRNGEKPLLFFAATLLMLLSMLSKPSALTFPALLILIDFFQSRKYNLKAVLEKIILFALVTAIGVIYYVNFPEHVSENTFTFFERIFLGGYAFAFYVIKSIAPFNLSLIRPYPTLPLPAIYYLSTVIALLLTAGLTFIIVRRYRSSKDLIFGVFFFLIHISMVLHIATPIGGVVVVADRYTYLPYLGIFFIASRYCVRYRHNNRIKTICRATVLSLALLFTILTYKRVQVWESAESIYTDIIAKNPDAWQAYNNLGFIYSDRGQDADALALFEKAIALKPDYAKAHFNKGVINYRNKQYDAAYKDFSMAAAADSLNTETFYKRGLCAYNMGNTDDAVTDFSEALRLNPNHADASNDRGWVLFEKNRYDEALNDFDNAIRNDSLFDMAYNNRGWLKYTLKDYNGALPDFRKAISINPSIPLYHLNSGLVRHAMRDFTGAIADYTKALQMRSDYPQVYLNRALSYLAADSTQAACADLEKARELGMTAANELSKLYCNTNTSAQTK